MSDLEGDEDPAPDPPEEEFPLAWVKGCKVQWCAPKRNTIWKSPGPIRDEDGDGL
jgi:hypothetical protein